MEEVKEKIFTDELEKELNSTEKTNVEFLKKILENKEDALKTYNDLKGFLTQRYKYKEHELLDELHSYYSDSDNYKNDFNLFNEKFEEFKYRCRVEIIAKKQRFIFLFRQEELLTNIANIQKELEEYKKFTDSHTDQEVMIKYSNQKLNEFAVMRSQTLPMFMVELETLATATKDNNELFHNCDYEIKYTAFSLIKILHDSLGLNEIKSYTEDESTEAITPDDIKVSDFDPKDYQNHAGNK